MFVVSNIFVQYYIKISIAYNKMNKLILNDICSVKCNIASRSLFLFVSLKFFTDLTKRYFPIREQNTLALMHTIYLRDNFILL